MKAQKHTCLHRGFGTLTVLAMLLIFCFSAQNGEESTAASDGFLKLLLLYLAPFLTESARLWLITWIRKMAHFTAYFILGFCLAGWSVSDEKDRKLRTKMLISLGIAVGYALTDEFHQLFVPGRAGRLYDVGIDSLGALTGIAWFLLIMTLLRAVLRGRKKKEKAGIMSDI